MNRAVVLVICFTLLSALVVTVVGAVLSQSELEQQAKNQVSTIAQLLAGDIDDKLARRLDTLSHVAASFTMDETALIGRASVLVRQQTALQHLFDGLYLIDEDGNILAEHPESYDLTGFNVSHRDYFQNASQRLTPVISEPYVSIYRDQPAVMIAAPIFDHRQKFIGVIGGALLLSGENFMEAVANLRIGETGYLGVATRSGITLAHGRTGQVMVPVRVGNPVLKDAMEGFEGTRQTRNGDGVRTIMSVQQMDQVPWFVAAVWPAREAFAPITRMTDAFLWTLLGVVGVVTPIALWRFRRLMAPLQVLGQQINERHLGVRTVP
ncbi:cache domain-containing protein, partial [Marinobacter alexandrii]